MATMTALRTVVYRADRQADGSLELHTNDGVFHTSPHSEACTTLRPTEFPGGLPVTLHYWDRDTMTSMSF